MPIVRVEPIYPTAAAASRIEGWVELSFTVLSSGRVSNVIVVDRHPKDTKVFDTPSIDAVSKWLYKPKVVDGKFVDTLGVTTKLQFSIISE